jgi:trehalose 6-phosphate phosphatase
MLPEHAAVPALREGDALFLDFDGTLAALQDNADTVHISALISDLVVACAERLGGALAILSGRDLDDLAQRVPDGVWRFGNHGLRGAAPGEAPQPFIGTPPPALEDAVLAIARRYPGVRVEPKGLVLAIHYRAAPDCAQALGTALRSALAPFATYGLQHGKMVFEAKPATANKGACLLRAMKMAPFAGRRPVMIGDDTTDEDAFIASHAAGGIAVKVGAGPTAADQRLASIEDVHRLLREFAAK